MKKFLDEKVTIIKDNDRRYENVEAQVDKGKIYIEDVKIPIEEGDLIIRKLPIGTERYKVLDRGYQSPFGPMPACYEMDVERIMNIDDKQEGDQRESMSEGTIKIFISHSKLDEDLAKALVKLLISSLKIEKEEIRCTSVPGYKFDPGIKTNEAIRKEVNESALLIGLLTPHSLKSTFVLFELGARWGIQKPLIPLLAYNADFNDLPSPIQDTNAVKVEKEEDLFDLIEAISKLLEIPTEKISSYRDELRSVLDQC